MDEGGGVDGESPGRSAGVSGRIVDRLGRKRGTVITSILAEAFRLLYY